MKNSKNVDPNWEPCHPGFLQEASKESISRRGLFQILGTGLVLSVVGAAVTVAVFADRQKPNSDGLPGGLACITVHENLIAFVDDKMTDAKLKQQVSFHLLKCQGCRDDYDELRCGDSCQSRIKYANLKPFQHSPRP